MRGTLPRLIPALACAAMATQATAQEMDRRVSRFDLGVYAGGAYTSNWFESRTVTLNGTNTPTENDDDEGFAPGFGGAFGAQATFWFTPMLGIRAHGAYLPMKFPNSDDAISNDSYVFNSYVFDLNLALRPFATRGGPLMSSLYLFAGGGGLLVDAAGADVERCEGTLVPYGACLSLAPEQATVGQGTAGLGVDLFPIGSALGLFAEAAVHVYDSPVHVGDDWLGPIVARQGATVRVADDATAVTGRLVLGVKAMFGDWVEAVPMVPPPPPPPPPAVVPPPPPPPPAPNPMREIRVCVVEGGMLREAMAMYNTQTGDTTWTGGMPSMSGYAAGASWFINNEAIMVMNRRYVRYGLPRVLGVSEVTRGGEYQGVPLFMEAGMTGTPEVLYVPVRPGCEFQPYQLEIKAGGVRGD